MRADASAYETLGLSPGADQAAIDRAYRELIKRYHPDRQGGDAARASEINRAYRELRNAPVQAPIRHEPSSVAEAVARRRAARLQRKPRKSRGRPLAAALILALLILFWKREETTFFVEDRIAQIRRSLEPSALAGADSAVPSRAISLDSPIDTAVVASAVDEVGKLHRAADESGLIEKSRDCHQSLRAEPTVELLDRCTALDNAVLELQRRDPMSVEGPFGPSAITARQMAAASLLSSDYEAIEERLDRVRLRVQALLAPSEQPIGIVQRVTLSGRPSDLTQAAP